MSSTGGRTCYAGASAESASSLSSRACWRIFSRADIMLTSQQTRRPKKFEFKLNNGESEHNDGFSDHFPIITTIETI